MIIGTKVIITFLLGKDRYSGKMAARVQAGGTSAPSLLELKQCLLLSYLQCSERGLLHSANWYKNHLSDHRLYDIINLWSDPSIKHHFFTSLWYWWIGQLSWPTALRLVIQCLCRSWSTRQSSYVSSPPTGWANHCLICASIGELPTPSGSVRPARPSSSDATPSI